MTKLKSLNVTEASAASLLIYIVGQLVAFVPNLAPEQAKLISTGTLIIAAVFALVHAVKAGIELVRDVIANKGKLTLADLEDGIRALAKDEISRVNIGGIVDDAINAKNLPDLAKVGENQMKQFVEHLQAALAQGAAAAGQTESGNSGTAGTLGVSAGEPA